MIYSNNMTSLGASNIPMAEGYDASYGPALALVETARNDYAMFNAMLEADWNEIAICKESSGVVQEGEILSLQEAVGGGIFKKIAELFRKLIAKIKSIFHNLIARLHSLHMKDKDLVKKYEKEIYRKTKLGNLEVKWRKVKEHPLDKYDASVVSNIPNDLNKFAEDHKDDVSERLNVYSQKYLNVDFDELEETLTDAIFEDEDTVKISEIDGGIRGIMTFLSGYSSNLSKFQSTCRKYETGLNRLVKDADKNAGEKIKQMKGDNPTATEADVTKANHAYDMTVAYQTVQLKALSVITKLITMEYKQNKAAFMKAVTANDKKLDESVIYAEAVAEAAEQEVEDVITGALSKEELSEINAASKNVKDADVTDDPDALTYGPNQYTANGQYKVDGSIDTKIDSKKEAAFFGQLLY